MDNYKKYLLTGLLSVLWMLAVFLSYASTHKPFDKLFLLEIINRVYSLFVALGLLSLAGGLGRLIKFKKSGLDPVIIAATEAVLGMSIIGISVLILGATIGVSNYLVFIVVICLIFSRKKIRSWWKDCGELAEAWRLAGKLGKSVAVLCGLLIGFMLFSAFSPTTQFDSLTYHLTLPKLFIQQGIIRFVSNNIFWGLAQLVEMLYLLCMLLGGKSAAHVFGLLVGIMTLAVVLIQASKKTGNFDAGWVAIASLLCGYSLVWLLSAAYTEWFVMLCGALTVAWLAQWKVIKDYSTIVILGIIGGIALSVKYTGGLILLSSGLIILLSIKKNEWVKTLGSLLLLLGSAFLVYLPWLLKNSIATGNPFYPIAFPANEMDLIRLNFYQFKPLSQDWSRILLIPWQATLLGVEGKVGYSASIGPLLLGLSPLAFLEWGKNSRSQKNIISIAATLTLFGFLVWGLGSQFRGLLIQTRLFLSFFPAWALLCAFGYNNLLQVKVHNVRFYILVSVFILTALSFNSIQVFMELTEAGVSANSVHLDSNDDYLVRNLGEYKPAMDHINTLPTGTKVLLLWETRSFHCLLICDPDEIIDRWYHDWTLNRSPEGVIEHWRDEGFTHVLLNNGGMTYVRNYDKVAPYKPEYWLGLDTTLNKLIKIYAIDKAYTLYQIPR